MDGDDSSFEGFACSNFICNWTLVLFTHNVLISRLFSFALVSTATLLEIDVMGSYFDTGSHTFGIQVIKVLWTVLLAEMDSD